MFTNQQFLPQQPQLPQLNLKEADTVTELSHVAESVVPHPLNPEYRLKHVFVNVGGKVRDPSTVPKLSPHEYIVAANQAQKFGVNIEKCIPTQAIGFEGLKARFLSQQAAIEQQQNLINEVKTLIARENDSYRKNCQERLRKWRQQTRHTETELLNLFRKVEETRLQFASKQGKRFAVKSSVKDVVVEVQKARRTSRDQNLKSRALEARRKFAVEMSLDAHQPSRKRTADAADDKTRKKAELVKRSRTVVHKMKSTLEEYERDVKVMQSRKSARHRESRRSSAVTDTAKTS